VDWAGRHATEREGAVEASRSFDVFINYRREDSAGHAGRLYDALSKHFGPEHVFMDIDTIDPGDDFAEVVEHRIASCDVLIALIGRRWLTTEDREGRRRLDRPEDWVRLELEKALERGDRRVIPALVEGAEMPTSDQLPDSLRKLSYRNAFELSDGRWHSDVQRLIDRLEALRGRRPGTRKPRWSRRVVAITSAALAGLLALVAAAFLLLGGGSDDGVSHYVKETDHLLRQSARTKGDLRALIADVQRGAVSRDRALSRIDQIIGQRRSLRDDLPVDVPAAFRHAQRTLRESIVLSLSDDEAVRRWIDAVYRDSSEAPLLYRGVTALSGPATGKKAEFLSEYNYLRDKKLHLAPIDVQY
jgi:hypothetical protein